MLFAGCGCAREGRRGWGRCWDGMDGLAGLCESGLGSRERGEGRLEVGRCGEGRLGRKEGVGWKGEWYEDGDRGVRRRSLEQESARRGR